MSTNNYFLFLDDERMPSDVTWLKLPTEHKWTIVRTFNDFCKVVNESGVPLFVSFDHDLADFQSDGNGNKSEKTGVDCARWLVDFCIDNNKNLPEFSVHSKNPIRSKEIFMTMKDFNTKKLIMKGP